VVGASAHERTLKHPLLWHPLDGFGVLWRHLAVPALEPTCEALGQLAHAGDAERLTVLASPLAVGARFARERWPDRIRLLSGYTAPMGLRSVEDPMFLGAWQVPSWMPEYLRILLWRAVDRWKLEPMAKTTLGKWQSRWGTPCIRSSVFGDWLHSPDGGVALYPETFAAVPRFWRERGVVQTGFPLFEPQHLPSMPASFASFVQRHSRYVLVYPGSAATAAGRINDLVLPVCKQLGLPCIVLSPHLHHTAHAAANEGSDILRLAQAPLRPLLAGACLFVHHGGIGSAAQALQQRVRQLVLASAYDQFENGQRIAKLGAGDWLRLTRAQPADVASLIEGATSARTAKNDKRSARFVGAEGPAIVNQTCDWMERAAAM
jgi:rhamnosyltransferase subunit B